MDPNETLRRMRDMIERDSGYCDSDEQEFIDLFEALDGWLSKGGFLPTDWRPKTVEAEPAPYTVQQEQARRDHLLGLSRCRGKLLKYPESMTLGTALFRVGYPQDEIEDFCRFLGLTSEDSVHSLCCKSYLRVALNHQKMNSWCWQMAKDAEDPERWRRAAGLDGGTGLSAD